MINKLFITLVLVVFAMTSFAQEDVKNHYKSNGGFSDKTMDVLDKPTNNQKNNTIKTDKVRKQKSEDESESDNRMNTEGDGRKAHSSNDDEKEFKTIERYAHYTMRNGWIEGIGKVTKEQAKHMTTFYEFSDRDREGHWGRIRALNGYGRMEDYYHFQRIFTNLDYDRATWQWDDIPKQTTEIRIHRGIKDGDLVYHYFDRVGKELCVGYSRKLSENSVLLHFSTDKDTIPLCKDKIAADCELIYCERDENGFDAYLKFFSRNGGLAINTDSASAIRRTYDKVGNRLTDSSLDITDAPMIDLAGNNGWEATYDAYGNTLTSTNMGVNWEAIIPTSDIKSYQYIRKHNEFDNFCRLTKEYYTDEKNRPMADGNGLASITYQYNDAGLQTRYCLYDILGRPFDGFGYFRYQAEYDKNGYIKSRKYYDKDGKLASRLYYELYEYDTEGKETLYECRNSEGNFTNNSNGGIAKKVISYDHNGSILNEDRWKVDSLGNLSLTYYRHENSDSIVYLRNDYRQFYLKDSSGNICADYRVNLNGDIIPSGSSKQYFKNIYTKIVEPHKTRYFDAYYDKNNKVIYNPDWDWSESWLYIDSVAGTKHLKEFNHNHQIVYNVLSQYSDFKDKKYTTLLLNDFDNPCWRNYYGTLWYKRMNIRNYNGTPVVNAYYNEWDEPAYVVSKNKSAYHMIFFADDNNVTYDEYGKKCDSLYMILPKALSIEVTDSVAYRLGIKDNDIILKYGDWEYKINSTHELDKAFYLETILKARNKKKLIILRSDSKNKKTMIKEIKLPQGRLSDLGIYPHLRCLASKENQRLVDCYGDYLSKHPIHQTDNSVQNSIHNWVLLYVAKRDRYNTLYTDMEIRSPFIALLQNFYSDSTDSISANKKDKHLNENSCPTERQWVLEDEQFKEKYSQLLKTNFNKIKVFYTDDFHTVINTDSAMTRNNFMNSVNLKWLLVSDSIYHQLTGLRETLRRDGIQVRELVNDSIVADSAIKYALSPLKTIKVWEKQKKYPVMTKNEVLTYLKKIELDDIYIDFDKNEFYGISVDEDGSKKVVGEYNILLSMLDKKKLDLLMKKDTSYGVAYVWGKKGHGVDRYKQLVIYNRNVFVVIIGNMQFLRNATKAG